MEQHCPNMSRHVQTVQISRHIQTYPDISTFPNVHVVDSKSRCGDSDSKSRFRPLSLRSRSTRRMVASCVICLGSSGQALAGKRCRASRCKAEYAARIKLAKAAAGGGSSTATSPTASAGAARSSAELESLVALKLWEMFGIYGRREYDPDTLTSYELCNGISADR